jgi:hypothetical protein
MLCFGFVFIFFFFFAIEAYNILLKIIRFGGGRAIHPAQQQQRQKMTYDKTKVHTYLGT